MPRTSSGMCNSDCRGCPNCLSMPSSGGSYSYYHHSETVIVSSGGGPILPMPRTIQGSGNVDDVSDGMSDLSMASSARTKSQPKSRRKSGVARWLENIGEDDVVNSRTPERYLLEAPRGSDSRSMVSSSSRRSNRSRRSSRDDDDDARTVVTLASLAPSDSVSGISSRCSDVSRRSSHAGSRVSSRMRDDDESTVRGPRAKVSIVSSRSRHLDDHSRVSSRHGAGSTVSSRYGGGSEVTSRVGSRLGASEVGSRVSSRVPNEAPSRRFSKDERTLVHPRFACTVPTDHDAHGDFLSASEKLELAISRETFFILTQRFFSFNSLLEAWKHRASAGCVIRHIDYDETTSSAISINFIISIQLSSSFTSLIVVHHDFASRSSTVLALRVNPHDQSLFQQFHEHQQRLIGHPLFVMTLLFAINLDTNLLYMHKIRPIGALAHDSELSRLGHAAEIHISIFRRRLDFLEHYLELSQQTVNELEGLIPSSLCTPVGLRNEYEQWLRNLATQFRLRQVDLTYYQRRIDNQITAIYGLLSQRDNMLGVSVAIESKRIPEASKRDGSSFKSLSVLATLFFPASYIATLFTLPHFTKTPPWTFYRQRRIAQETTDQGVNPDVELDPEVAFASSSNAASSTILVSTLSTDQVAYEGVASF
ncbi:uncharacterized protein KD926_004289 [Aspergillus affinis]|uniref:uncharacterized protein n=1 Tax=Aspergillus affinis TaxID=1070780 RepID=UPI0022FDDA5D|nr:uncharacterized protein KD926_004289 [Aspergillus affinis]KAI9035205.1 hypothetical protein KD926_004289 [Aspergillus affinis]